MTKQVGFALVGCGRVAYRHAEALSAAPSARLVAVCDLKEDRARDLGAKAGVPFFTNYNQMLAAHRDIDVVNVITPSGAHYEHARDIIEQHKKHVLIEKPMVMTPDQGIALKKAADQAGIRVFPIFQNRFNRAVMRVKQGLASADELGAVRVGTVRMRWCRPQRYYDLSEWRGTWAMDGGALTNQGIHYIDLLRHLCGEVKRVSALTASLGAKIEVEDTAVATIEFKSGALGVIEVMTSARNDDFEASVSCVGSNGLAVIAGIATNELKTYSPKPEEGPAASEVFPTVYGFGHNEVMERVARSLLGDKQAQPTTFEDALETIRLLHAIYRSSETGGWVSLDGEIASSRLGKLDAKGEKLLAQYRTPKGQLLL